VQSKSSRAESPTSTGAPVVHDLRVILPVKELRCGNGTMEEKLRDALKAEQFPNIEFALTSMKETESKGPEHSYEVKGNLTIAGKTKPISFSMSASPDADDTLASTASVRFLMSDFGVDPPTAMLIMKTYDQVVINLQLRVDLVAFTN
jgi:polyisoprenoid-binding protein YceI